MITVIASGYFNPIHIGHLRYLQASREKGDRLWVIVNNDRQVELKRGIPFMPEADRAEIVSAFSCVDRVILATDEDRSVCATLRALCAFARAEHFQWTEDEGTVVFTNGGDQTLDRIPEADVCDELGIEMVFGIVPQLGESSKILERFIEATDRKRYGVAMDRADSVLE